MNMMECITWGSFPAQHLHLGLHCISAKGICTVKRFRVKETKYALLFRKFVNYFHNCYTWKYVAFIEPALLIEPAMEKSLPAYLKVKV